MDGQKMDNEMQAAAAEIITRFKDHGFVLLVYPLDNPKEVNHISNGPMENVPVILKMASWSLEKAIYEARARANTPKTLRPLNGNG